MLPLFRAVVKFCRTNWLLLNIMEFQNENEFHDFGNLVIWLWKSFENFFKRVYTNSERRYLHGSDLLRCLLSCATFIAMYLSIQGRWNLGAKGVSASLALQERGQKCPSYTAYWFNFFTFSSYSRSSLRLNLPLPSGFHDLPRNATMAGGICLWKVTLQILMSLWRHNECKCPFRNFCPSCPTIVSASLFPFNVRRH